MFSVLLCNQYPVAITSRSQTHSLSLNHKSYNADMVAAVHLNARAVQPAVVSEQQIQSVPLISVSPRALRYRRANEALTATQCIIQLKNEVCRYVLLAQKLYIYTCDHTCQNCT